MQSRGARALLLASLLLLSCRSGASSKSPAGFWRMGPITEPSSSFEEKFPAQAWAASVPPGAELTLSGDGSVYSGAAEIAKLDGGWSDREVRFSFQSTEPTRKLNLQTEFSGAYDPAGDLIQGSFSQKTNIGPLEIVLRGRVSFSRVPE
jgi:hypothetical protein